MALVILDPNLEGEGGHHLAYDLAIAREALARGRPATIVANRAFRAGTIEGVRILPHFTTSTYAREHDDPVSGAADDWKALNDRLLAELSLLPRAETPPEAAVLVPTTTENHLAGYLAWMKGFDPAEAPLFAVHLMFPAGVTLDAAGAMAVEEPLRALFYRMAERLAQEDGPEVHLFASGGQRAAEFGALFGRAIPPHPLPIRPEPGPPRPHAAPRVLLFAGDARPDKGIALLPGLLPRLAAAHPGATFAAHVNAERAWGEARQAAEALAALAGSAPNIEILTGRLAPGAYLDMLRASDLVVLPYDPRLARRKSSGVLWEAVSLGIPLVVPDDTWLAAEARHWGAGHLACPAHDEAALAEAVEQALTGLGSLAARSAEAGARYRAANGPAALLDQLAPLWVRHAATASLIARPVEGLLDIARLGEGWHRMESVQGQPARWSDREAAIAFDWPFETPWELELGLLAFFGPEQLEQAVATGGPGPVSLRWRREGGGARMILRGAGPGRASPRIELRLRLPHTHRPAHESRDLGILLASLRLGPAPQAGAPAPREDGDAPRPLARVAAPPRPGGGWDIAPTVSGEVLAEPGRPYVLAFRIAAEAPPALALRLGGASARLSVAPDEAGGFLATAALPAALLRAAGEPAPWDLLAEGGPPAVLLSVAANPLAGASRRPLPPPAEVPALDRDEARLRWDLSEGIGEPEGPYPDLGLHAGVRWVIARRACLVIDAPETGPVRLHLDYRCLVPRQEMRAALNGAAAGRLDLAGGGLHEAREAALDLVLQAGRNELALAFEAGVTEPGTGRDLVLLIAGARLG
jgi:glycosyltransferase involved in cell wall biosynthesis